jgi:UDP-N-acetylglucosamine--N-acetylmuramyl-(pentapeptide) pyrophosphoryl-undecaprenol N-acetylglucosamine transferase
VGGYVSWPVLDAAAGMGIPTLIQEQNSFPGKTNKMLASKAVKICTAYDNLERYFPKEKTVKTGNPVRQDIISLPKDASAAYAYFDLNPQKFTVSVVGGSLGARTINESVLQHLDLIANSGLQFIWQTGKYYSEEIAGRLKTAMEASQLSSLTSHLKVTDFISDMATAYKAADLVISRAGAGSISEFCLLGKPVILVPSPNVAEDHQTKNAMALVNHDAALYVKDAEAPEKLIRLAIDTVKDDARLTSLSKNILKLALPNSAEVIAKEVIALAQTH